MKLEPMADAELLALMRESAVQALPDDVLHRVLWALAQAHAANVSEKRAAELEAERDRYGRAVSLAESLGALLDNGKVELPPDAMERLREGVAAFRAALSASEGRAMDIDHGVRRWLDAGKYLPPEFRDFHDQKDVFKSLFHDVDIPELSWIDAHIFTVDTFLWYMAAHGYTLQQSRQRLRFCDLQESVRRQQEAEADAFRAALAASEEATEPTAN